MCIPLALEEATTETFSPCSLLVSLITLIFPFPLAVSSALNICSGLPLNPVSARSSSLT
jgi:hypothetical protein